MPVPVSCVKKNIKQEKMMDGKWTRLKVTKMKLSFSLPLHLSLQVFKLKAVQLAEKLLPAFNTPTGIPWAMVNLKRSVTLPPKTSSS